MLTGRQQRTHMLSKIILSILIVVTIAAHANNMFAYPYYENDEGVYMSQAWSLLTSGKLAPYTYWYDHAPFGWIMIAGWTKLTGGFFTFGPSVNSGRVFMLVLHTLSAVMLFYIAKKLSGRNLAGIITVLIFSLSPLAIYFQRRVLLDNMMIFLVLLSLSILLVNKLKLRHVIVSAVIFGLSVLTKENAIFFIPAFLVTIYTVAHKHHRNFAMIEWLGVSALTLTPYFLYAILKNEFFPVGFLGNSNEHVSLITSFSQQLSRGGDAMTTATEWIVQDPFLTVLGVVSTIFGLLFSIKIKSLRIPSIFSLMMLLFLFRGKLVLNFYILAAIPFLALSIGVFFDFVAKKISINNHFYNALSIILVVAWVYIPVAKSQIHWLKDETTSQIKALNWIRDNLDENDYIVIDNHAYVDLHDPNNPSGKVFKNADWFQKLNLDKEIQLGKYNNDWHTIQYVALSHEMVRQSGLLPGDFEFLRNAIQNSNEMILWKQNADTFIDPKNYISTNGDWMAIYKVKDTIDITLDNSWDYYKRNYIHSYGQVVDPENGRTTSEGQSYAMLRAVWMNDQQTFDGLWSWTRDHMQKRTQDKLFSWLWMGPEGQGQIIDPNTASDADTDIALALLIAGNRWQDEKYITDAKEIITDVWDQEVVKVRNQYYLTSGYAATRPKGYLVNPSYLSPASYRLFAQVDTENPWEDLAWDSYVLLNQFDGLPPNWILVDKTGKISSAEEYINDPDANHFGYDAFRTFFRIALDAKWFKDPAAKKFLAKYQDFFENQWKGGQIYAIYDSNGSRISGFSSISTTASAMSNFVVQDSDSARSIFENVYEKDFNQDGYWGDKNNYYDQNWAWFATAMYAGQVRSY